MKLTLRAKGALTVAALAVYVSAVGWILTSERQRLLELALEIEQVHVREGSLNRAINALNHALVRAQESQRLQYLRPSDGDDMALDLELVQSALQELRAYYPRFNSDIQRVGAHVRALRQGVSLPDLIRVLDAEASLSASLDDVGGGLNEARREAWARYYSVYERMTLLAVSLNLFGILAFGTVVTLFFARLTWDLDKVGGRAADVARGLRGAPLEITRCDEVGGLMTAVNRMDEALRRRERELEIAREQHFHREKLAAMGSLAAAVAHEINNPIAAIAGIAQSLREAAAAPAPLNRAAMAESAGLIAEQTARISAISRQIQDFTRPQSRAPELFDLNGLVRTTCKFIGYDRRMRGIDVSLDLDPQLPAAFGVADHLAQILVNLLINAADACQDLAGRRPAIRVFTAVADGSIAVRVIDNGHGMDAQTRARAFEEGFSTKAEEAGRGIGLFMCKTLIEGDGGVIELQSAVGKGTEATVRIPVQREAAG